MIRELLIVDREQTLAVGFAAARNLLSGGSSSNERGKHLVWRGEALCTCGSKRCKRRRLVLLTILINRRRPGPPTNHSLENLSRQLNNPAIDSIRLLWCLFLSSSSSSFSLFTFDSPFVNYRDQFGPTNFPLSLTISLSLARSRLVAFNHVTPEEKEWG